MTDAEKKEIVTATTRDVDLLLKIMAALRSENGCPWDRVQTHKSIRRDLIEETYEVAEAIDNGDPVLLREELGDLLLQIVFHARMEEEEGRFTFDDVVSDLCEKLIRRHPHVFGDVNAEDPDGALASWNAAKEVEKKRGGAQGDMKAIPPSLPSLMRARKTAKVALKDGYGFGSAEEILSGASRRLARTASDYARDPDGTIDALSSVLFEISTVFALLGADPEENLNKKTADFIDTYTNI